MTNTHKPAEARAFYAVEIWDEDARRWSSDIDSIDNTFWTGEEAREWYHDYLRSGDYEGITLRIVHYTPTVMRFATGGKS